MKQFEKYMYQCFDLAKKGLGSVSPNPLVGCVVLDKNDEVISVGYHKKYGMAHAEVNCINSAPQNTDFSKTTLVVNLEPCSHFGKTPPCADLIIKKGIKKVVIGLVDPNEKVKGNGIKKLKDAGIEVIYPFMEMECTKLNKIFIKNITQKKPYIAIKTATTIDSKIASDTNSSKWITSNLARLEVQNLRTSYQAIMTGSGTILADNPKLNVRIKGKKSPTRIIFDPNNKASFDYDVFNNDGSFFILRYVYCKKWTVWTGRFKLSPYNLFLR